MVHTDSTTGGRLAPLNGMIRAGDVEFNAEGTSTTTLWEWQSGIHLPTTTTTTIAEEGVEELQPNEVLVPTEE